MDIEPAVPSKSHWYHYYWPLFGYFGKECYQTWRWELFASVLVGFFSAVIAGNWKDFKTALLATGLTLGCIAIGHLVRAPWMFYRSPNEIPGTLAKMLGVLVIVCVFVGGFMLGVEIWNAKPLGEIVPRFIITPPLPNPSGSLNRQALDTTTNRSNGRLDTTESVTLLYGTKNLDGMTLEAKNGGLFDLSNIRIYNGTSRDVNVTMRLYFSKRVESNGGSSMWQETGSDEDGFPAEFYTAGGFMTQATTVHRGETWNWIDFPGRPKPGEDTGEGIEAMVKVFGLSKPLVARFHIKNIRQ